MSAAEPEILSSSDSDASPLKKAKAASAASAETGGLQRVPGQEVAENPEFY